MAQKALQHVERIVVLRANGLGDYIFALPALEAIRARYPDAFITYVGLPWHRAELEKRPGPVNRYVVAPQWPGVSTPDTDELRLCDVVAAEEFFATMRAERFDLGVQLHGGGGNSNAFVRAMNPAFAVGTRTPEAATLNRSLPYDYYQPEVLRWLAVAELADAPPVVMQPRWIPTAEEMACSRELLPPDGRPLAIVNPGAGVGRRRWSAERFARVADQLATQDARIVVTGTRADAQAAREVIDSATTAIESLVGVTCLKTLGALMSRASVVVTNDSGPLHLARAAGAATVGVYWFGNVINAGPPGVLRHRTAISWRRHCPECAVDCTSNDCDHDSSFVNDVTVGEVAGMAEDLLARCGHADAWYRLERDAKAYTRRGINRVTTRR